MLSAQLLLLIPLANPILLWDDIDFDNKIININKTLSFSAKSWRISTPKTKDSVRSIPFGAALSEILLLTGQKWKRFTFQALYLR